MSRAFVQAQWARLIAVTLADCGVRDVLVSPGSRSTALVWAMLDCDALTCHSVIDERGAAFAAVARAKISGRPAALLCTSGTAAANYFPAVVEAAMSHTPLLVLTADRPNELADSGANQTIDQTRIYGDFARRSIELGSPDGSLAALRSLRRRLAQAVALTQEAHPGPVHINVRAHKPLEPAPPSGADDGATLAAVEALLQKPPASLPRSLAAPSEATLSELSGMIERSHHPLIVCGPTPPARALDPALMRRFARACGAPVFAEATSGLRFASGGVAHPADGLSWMLRGGRLLAQHPPDLLLQIGATPTCEPLHRWLEQEPQVPLVCLTEHGHPDPASCARLVVRGALDTLLTSTAQRLGPLDRSDWTGVVARENERVWGVVGDVVAARSELTEPRAVREVVQALPDRSLLAVGNSLPVRLLDEYCRTSATDCLVWSQRGASGIDGLVSGGLAAVRQAERPGVLLIGDVSLLHDVGGLLSADGLSVPCAIVVLNNGGGRIFDQLPIGTREDRRERMRFWTTPHTCRFSAAAELFSLSFARAETPGELRMALSTAMQAPGVTLVEAVVPPSSAKQVASAVKARLEALG